MDEEDRLGRLVADSRPRRERVRDRSLLDDVDDVDRGIRVPATELGDLATGGRADGTACRVLEDERPRLGEGALELVFVPHGLHSDLRVSHRARR